MTLPTRRMGRAVDFVASEPHFVDHLAGVYEALPDAIRGRFYCGVGSSANTHALDRARGDYGIPARGSWPPPGSLGLAVVAAIGDLTRTRYFAPRKRFVYTEHGCGISYNKRRASYVGSPTRPNVDMILMPNEIAAAKQERATPHIDIRVVGSSPRLDPWAPGGAERLKLERSDPPVVCLSFHWECTFVPETRSALYHYRRHLHVLMDRGWEIIGHAHPRIWPTAKAVYQHWGIEPVRDFDEVMRRASIYVCDNSSTLFEFAATDRPVVAMNCPHYRRDVEHGIRFWDHVPGLQVDQAEELPEAIERSLEGDPESVELREAAVDAVFPRNDGGATRRAAEAIAEQWEKTRVEVRNPQDRPIMVYTVRDARGKLVEEHLTEYEAKSHARAIGGSYKGEMLRPQPESDPEPRHRRSLRIGPTKVR